MSEHPSAIPYVAVAGSGDAAPELLAAAEEVGAGLAAGGAVVVTGGLGGIMEAASRGARSKLGQTVGVLPGTDRADANGWVGTALTTGMGEQRNVLIAQSCDVLVAIGAGYGTLSEVAMTLKLGRPVVSLWSWEVEGVLEVTTPDAAVARALELAAPRVRPH
ncbi:MAG TPA: TIGR00725 family protein [Solirubrobacteraceae bacterium]|nr:TIGR00725 family protein [Solirubrobacteraceae bacterium]